MHERAGVETGHAPRPWLERVPPRLAAVQLAVWVVALLVLLASPHIGGRAGYDGGWRINAVIYALFEPFFAWGVILGLLRQFQCRLNAPTRLGRLCSERAYAVYCIHAPVLVAVSRGLSPWEAQPLMKFVAAGAAGCALSLLAASAILWVPGARRILVS